MSNPRDYDEEYTPDPPDEENGEMVICADCNGSGEGMYDGSRCSTCRGKGEVWEAFPPQPEEDDDK